MYPLEGHTNACRCRGTLASECSLRALLGSRWKCSVCVLVSTGHANNSPKTLAPPSLTAVCVCRSFYYSSNESPVSDPLGNVANKDSLKRYTPVAHLDLTGQTVAFVKGPTYCMFVTAPVSCWIMRGLPMALSFLTKP